MKINALKCGSLRVKKGFTLIEILIVITIMAFLMAAAWMARNYFIARGQEKTAESRLSLIVGAMDAYKADNGGVLPYANGDEWSGHVLYMMLSGDTNNDGKPDKNKRTNQMRTAYISELAYLKAGEKDASSGIPVLKRPLAKSPDDGNRRGARYILLDPWSNAFRYTLGCEAECTTKKEGNGINPDFDIFSLGADGLGNGRNKEGDNKDNLSNIKVL